MRAAEPLGSAGRPWLSSSGTELPREVRKIYGMVKKIYSFLSLHMYLVENIYVYRYSLEEKNTFSLEDTVDGPVTTWDT